MWKKYRFKKDFAGIQKNSVLRLKDEEARMMSSDGKSEYEDIGEEIFNNVMEVE